MEPKSQFNDQSMEIKVVPVEKVTQGWGSEIFFLGPGSGSGSADKSDPDPAPDPTLIRNEKKKKIMKKNIYIIVSAIHQ